MTWQYSQLTGQLSHDGADVAVGYSGFGEGRNNPDLQAEPNVGPLPVGKYTIGAPHDTPTHGPYVLRLEPDPENDMLGRAGFLIHGDNATSTASHGCIILPRAIRTQIWASGDRALVVV